MNRFRRFSKAVSSMLIAGLLVSTVSVGGAAASSTLLLDDFEDGDASGWSVPSGFAVQPAAVGYELKYSYIANSATRKYASAGSSSWTQYAVEMKFKSASDANQISLHARYRNDENHYALQFDSANDLVKLVKRVNGTATTLDSASIALQLNTYYTLKLSLDDDTLTGYVDGVPLLEATDPTYTSGRIAVGGYSKSSYSVDDVVVTDLRRATRLTVMPENATLLENEVRKLSATVFDQGDLPMNDVQIAWSSDDAAVASVAGDGSVTGVSPGETVVRAVYDALTDSSNVVVEELVTEPPIHALHTLQAPVVDGLLDDSVWTLDRTARKQVLGTNGNSVNFGTLWDDKYFYVGVEVIDDQLWNDSTDSFDDDSVEFFLDTDHNHGSTYDLNDWHFRKGYNDTTLFERLDEAFGTRHAAAAIPGGYAVEIAIPWINLGLTPTAGLDFGFDLGVNDDDTGGSREGQLVWTGIADNYKNTVAFGDAMLTADTVGTPQPPSDPAPVDRYVTPHGAGAMDGSDWDNAFAGDGVGGLQAAWNATGKNNTLHVGSGTYVVPQTLSLSSGGSDPLTLKKLVGVDTGGGAPVFQGDYTLSNQINRSFIDVPLGVDYWQIENLVIRNYYYGVYARGQHEGIRIFDVDMHDMSDGVYLWGRATRSNPDAGSHDIVIKGGEYTNYTKSAVRFRNGNYNASVIGVTADAGGQANYASGNFPMGFRIGNSPEDAHIFDHDIVFQDVVSRNSWHQDGSDYWNGDGFAAERQTYNLTYVRSKAFDSTDGGWDDKSANPAFIDTVSFGNKRNYRIWSADTATFIRAIGAYSHKRGGSGDSVGLWVGSASGKAEAYFSTFYNNENGEIALERSENQVFVSDSIIGDGNGGFLYANGGGQLVVTNSEEYLPGVQGTDPQFINGGNADWEGGSADFNSQVYGASKGYFYPGPNTTPYTLQIDASGLQLGEYEEAAVSVQVVDGGNQPVSDPENVIWYSDDAYVARLLQSRGANAVIQGLYPGTTELVALYKGAEARIQVVVSAAVSDNEAPVTTDDAPLGWANRDVQVQLNATDVGSGVAATYYRLNGGAVTQGTSVAVSEEGVHTLEYWSEDVAGNAEQPRAATVNVDKKAPVLGIALSPTEIWPPNQGMVDVQATIELSDEASGGADLVLTAITSDEPIEADDIQGAEFGTYDTNFQLRAERDGAGDGRVYTIVYTATDAAGNVMAFETHVLVPHDRSGKK
jgi:hypothetical protein